MAAADINKGSAMEEHSDNAHRVDGQKLDPRFWQHARFPANTHRLNRCDGSATAVGSCGDRVTIELAVDHVDHLGQETIRAVRQFPEGCLYTTACASAVSVLAQGRTLEKALEIQPEDVEAALGGLPEDHRHCARLAVNTLGEAIADFYRQALNGLKKEIQKQKKGVSHAHL